VAVARFPRSAYASVMRGTELDVLDANAAFYRAFATRDADVFVREGGAWRMVHHQATPMTPPRQARPLPRGSVAN
jgi:hypothetical protein